MMEAGESDCGPEGSKSRRGALKTDRRSASQQERLVAAFENTVLISRPIEDVFAFLSDFENVPKWNDAIVETRKVSEGAVGVGTIYQQVRSVPSRSGENFEKTKLEPGATPTMLSGVHQHRGLKPVGGGIRLSTRQRIPILRR
jgi:hypothetical protein